MDDIDVILTTPIFWVLISLMAFEIGIWINKKTKISLLNPLLIAIILVIVVLTFLNIDLETYNQGGQIISFFLGPATVALAVPLYKNRALLKTNGIPILVGITVGSFVSILSVILLSKLFDIEHILGLSLVPKSITTPIGIEVSKQIGGIPEITVAAIVMTGITGAIIARLVFKVLRLKDSVAIGVAIGTSAHALGTGEAIKMGEVEGAMSGLSIGIAGLVTVILAPLVIRMLGYF
ncbi:LrgB family protein [Petrocella sp. FN5]|uniref:LrgB family protein n=1 Tax=Petrocella sp. FN5 TaxID=3032002 RepID=UPI002ED106DA